MGLYNLGYASLLFVIFFLLLVAVRRRRHRSLCGTAVASTVSPVTASRRPPRPQPRQYASTTTTKTLTSTMSNGRDSTSTSVWAPLTCASWVGYAASPTGIGRRRHPTRHGGPPISDPLPSCFPPRHVHGSPVRLCNLFLHFALLAY